MLRSSAMRSREGLYTPSNLLVTVGMPFYQPITEAQCYGIYTALENADHDCWTGQQAQTVQLMMSLRLVYRRAKLRSERQQDWGRDELTGTRWLTLLWLVQPHGQSTAHRGPADHTQTDRQWASVSSLTHYKSLHRRSSRHSLTLPPMALPYLTLPWVGRLLHLPSTEAASVRPNAQPRCNQKVTVISCEAETSAVKPNKSPATWDWWRVVWLFLSGGLRLVSSSPSD